MAALLQGRVLLDQLNDLALILIDDVIQLLDLFAAVTAIALLELKGFAVGDLPEALQGSFGDR